MEYEKLKSRLNQIIQENKEGFTYSIKQDKLLKKGYAVALTDRKPLNFKSNEDNLLKLIDELKSYEHILNKICVGGYLENGVFYLDISIIKRKYQTAKYFMIYFNQRSMFNLNNFKLIVNKKYRGENELYTL